MRCRGRRIGVCHAPSRKQLRRVEVCFGSGTSSKQRITTFRAFSIPNPVLLTYLTPTPAHLKERMVGTVVDRDTLVENLRNIVGRDAVFSRPADLLVYE